MFGVLFKERDASRKHNMVSAEAMYAAALTQTRQEVFFREYGVPDTFDGRFDLLLLHIFLILNKILKWDRHEDLSQALFDVTFRDMDQTLREMGIGDMGIPKHMRRMMMAFNGRMHSYQIALEPESLKSIKVEGLKASTLPEALTRNLYATVPNTGEEEIKLMERYMRSNVAGMSVGEDGKVTFIRI